MACNMWEEMGLLYSSGELNDEEQKTFRDHLPQCTECTEEFRAYEKERRNLFTIGNLGEVPSSECDAEILRVCSQRRTPIASVPIFSLFLKRSAISLTLFFLGFTIVGYLAFRMEFSDQQKNIAQQTREKNSSAQNSVPNENTVTEQLDSAAADSAENSKVNFANRRGNLDLKGVYPVDLQNK